VSDHDLFVTTSEAETAGVRVNVRARFSPEHSSPAASRWFFLYTIRISNEGETAVQLLNRHWTIVDGTGHTEEVQGPGVVGEQPTLQPGQAFEYTSGCPLPTPFGSMAGSFDMQRADGTHFEAEVALFQLIQPGSIH
jgi:ApaG protein